MSEQRRGFGVGELLLVGISLCVMVALGIATASAFTQPDGEIEISPVIQPAPTAALTPVVPDVEQAAPVASGSGVSPVWVSDLSQRTGIGEVALRAYGTATLRLTAEQPGCKVGWTTLAGIGGIESGHGTSGGASLLPDGTTSQPIVGPPLDGTAGNAAIRSTPESVPWHGDAQWDHAVGPMQFIPSTWERWQSDGNGDGLADPSNVYDAAYAAARYLCASGGDLTTGPAWTRSVFSYNHSENYVRSVLAYANAYASR